jgi:K+-sensing histidine kinase KdpD
MPVIPTGELSDGSLLKDGRSLSYSQHVKDSQYSKDSQFLKDTLGNGSPAVVPQVAHELLTPLTAILGILELLVDDTVSLDPEETTELVGLARDDAKQMTFLIADLLVSYRLANERLHPQVGPVGLQEAVVSALANFPRILRRTFVSPSLQLAASADPNLLQQIITNLIQNVDRYAPSGEVEVTFGTTATDVWIKISDDGSGIPIGERAGVFGGGRAGVGLGLGLGLSRALARAMGGDLECIEPLRSGATFKLTLPASSERVASVTANNALALLDADRMLSPRARLLVDMTVALTERSLDRALAGMQTLCAALLKAETGVVLVLEHGSFKRAGSFGSTGDAALSAEDRHLKWVVDNGRPNWVERLDEGSQLTTLFGTGSALLMPIFQETTLIGIFALEWTQAVRPSGPALEVASALARLAAFAIERASLAADVIYERQLRSSVMEFLPLAISVYVGDPPRLVDRNRRERMMLGIQNDDESPVDLIASQKKFNVRYIDGTPLDLDNAPVTWAIRNGQSSGPVMLRVRRADNSEVTVRMYCAPFFDDQGKVAGAVVSSEEMDSSPHPSLRP